MGLMDREGGIRSLVYPACPPCRGKFPGCQNSATVVTTMVKQEGMGQALTVAVTDFLPPYDHG